MLSPPPSSERPNLAGAAEVPDFKVEVARVERVTQRWRWLGWGHDSRACAGSMPRRPAGQLPCAPQRRVRPTP
jgi:hypothetical protein